jgi:hypothetical protein
MPWTAMLSINVYLQTIKSYLPPLASGKSFTLSRGWTVMDSQRQQILQRLIHWVWGLEKWIFRLTWSQQFRNTPNIGHVINI